MTLKLLILKLWPKLLVVLVGVGLYWLVTTYLEGDLKALFIGISSTLISIPFIIIFYEIWREETHRKLNESAYDFAQNQMMVSIGAIKSKLDELIKGAFIYLDQTAYVIDDEDIENIRFNKRSDDFPGYDDEWDDDLLSFELANIFEAITDARYLGYQLRDINIEGESSDLQALLANSFIMDRVDDNKTRIIINLVKSVKMLHSFLELHHDVFVRSSIRIHGLELQNMDAGIIALVYAPEDSPAEEEAQVFDINVFDPALSQENLLSVYVVNPDYYAVLSDHINDVLDWIRQWKLHADSIYIDYEGGRIAHL